MASETLTVPQKDDQDLPEQLYRHSTKPEWGLALLVWEKNGRRGYQFEDGRLRKIREGYYGLLDPIDEFDGPTAAVRANLQAAIEARQNGSEQKVIEPVCSFDQQIELFLSLFPKGFKDPEWVSYHRGSDEGNSLKRHRDPAITAAREALDPSRGAALIEGGKQTELTEAVLDVLAGTNLVPISHVKALRRLDDDESTEFAEVAFALVHGEGEFDDRFRAYLGTVKRLLGGPPSWREATALMALVYPQEHAAIRRSAFIRQAGSIAPTGAYSRRPRVMSYRSYRRIALGAKTRLEAAGHAPKDLLDVHDFIWATLRKSALDHL